MKNFTLYLLLLFFGSSFFSYSQENFKPGFIINLKGDTLTGFIDYRNWDKNPSSIIFRESERDQKVEYDPLTILAFSVADENYLSATVKIETSPYLLNDLKTDAELHFESEPAFLYCLVEGKKSLYHYKDARDKDHFYISSDSNMTLLIHKAYIKEVRKEDATGPKFGKSFFMENKYYYRVENKQYLGQLISYLTDCQDILPIISSIKYSQSDLLKVFNIYEKKCDNALKVNTSRKGTINLGVIGGMSLNTLQWGENESFSFSKTKYDYKPIPVAGLFLEFKFRGNNGKWSVNNELLYAPFRVEGTYINFINDERYSRIESEIGSGYFKLNNMLRFRFPLGNWSIFANGGLSSSYGKVTHNIVKTHTRNYSQEYSEIDIAMENTDKFELGFNVGLGGGYKSWSFEARHEQGDGMSSLVALNSKTKRFYLILGYHFNSKN